MEVTRHSDYACRILRAAYRGNGEYVSIAQISEDEGIPYAFARTIQHDLVRAGIVKTRRGAHGGLALAVDPSQISLLQIMEAIQGTVAVAPCSSDPSSCCKSHGCSFNKVWVEADRLLSDYFARITLKDVLEG